MYNIIITTNDKMNFVMERVTQSNACNIFQSILGF